VSTQPTTLSDEAQSPKSVGTQELARFCKLCGDNITHKRPQAKYCTECQRNGHGARDKQSELEAELISVGRNIAFAYLNRDRAIGFDGRYEGPLNQCFTVLVTIRKDKPGTPQGHADHCRPIEPRFNNVTPDDVDWADRQRAFAHTQSMPRAFNSFCVNCAEMVIGADKVVRITRGVYLPIEHQCNSVRVYDLAGTLLEVKPL
jgi:hypothetical protein